MKKTYLVRWAISLGLSLLVFFYGCYMAITQPHWVYTPAGWITSIVAGFFFLLAGYYVLKYEREEDGDGND